MYSNCVLKLSFGSKIKFVSAKEFERIYPKERTKDEFIQYPCDWIIDETVSNKKRAGTDGISSCNTGGFTNSERVSMFHLNPINAIDFIGNVKNRLKQELSLLRTNNKPINSLIFGGREKNGHSMDLFLNLKNLFKEENLNPSIFWGQKGCEGYSAAFYSNVNGEDTWYLHTVFSEREHDVSSLDDLKKAFKYVCISDQDELFIDGKKVDQQEIKQKFPDKLKQFVVYIQEQLWFYMK